MCYEFDIFPRMKCISLEEIFFFLVAQITFYTILSYILIENNWERNTYFVISRFLFIIIEIIKEYNCYCSTFTYLQIDEEILTDSKRSLSKKEKKRNGVVV